MYIANFKLFDNQEHTTVVIAEFDETIDYIFSAVKNK